LQHLNLVETLEPEFRAIAKRRDPCDFALQPTYWGQPQEDVLRLFRPADAAPDWTLPPYERIADGSRAVWICELGSRKTWGTFKEFVARIAESEATGDINQARYVSPSLGLVEFGWDRTFEVNGKAIALRDYPRFDNPWCRADFGETRYVIRKGQEALELDACLA